VRTQAGCAQRARLARHQHRERLVRPPAAVGDLPMSTDIAKIQDLQWYGEVPRSIRTHTIFGLALLGLSFGGFGVWAATAPLAAAVISQGSFVATGQNKIVQHFEGGIIKELMVNEGDQVTEGQPLG